MKWILLSVLVLTGCNDAPVTSQNNVSAKGDPDQWWEPKGDPDQYVTHGKKHHPSSPVAVATIQSASGVVVLSDAMFSENPDAAVLFRNTFGTVGYGEPCFRLTRVDGGPVNPDYPNNLYSLLCALTNIYNPNPSNDVILSASFDFQAVITYEPDYALSYMPLPRFVVTLQ